MARLPLRQALARWGCAVLLAGCSTQSIENFYDSKISPTQPIDWWHQLQGGPIAQQRPPPPGVTDPYPNFSVLPPKPTAIDQATRRDLLARMIAQREQAQRTITRDPVVWPVPGVPPSPAAPTTQAGTPPPSGAAATGPATAAKPATAPASAPDTSSLTFDAASSSPAPGSPAPAPPPMPTEAHPPAALTQAALPNATPVASGPIPAVPTAAPALPTLSDLPIAVPVPAPSALASATIGFAPGSATLPATAVDALRAVVAKRVGAMVDVQAGGDARSSALSSQRAGLTLALARAGAVSDALIKLGVPASAISAQAVPQGRDATARLLN